jgi:two-component system, OmpR family, sensor histidine kinase KdpD
MPMNKTHRLRQPAGRVALGAAAVAFVTFVCFRLQLNVATTGFLFLLVIVVQSLFSGFVASAIVSVIATACLEYFIVPPVLEWQIDNPIDAVALVTFLVTALVITRLESKVRDEARSAERRRMSLEGLYEVTRQLLALGPETDISQRLLQTFRKVFELQAVCLYESATGETRVEGTSRGELAQKTREACLSNLDSDDPVTGLSVRCLRVLGTTTGAIGFEVLYDPALTAGALSALAVAAIERVRVFRNASIAAAAAETEVFRGIVLDVLAHEFKTPLATISTAAGSIRESGPLRRDQLEMAETIESEASRLGNLTSRLLRVARLDSAEVKLCAELSDVGTLVTHTVGQYAARVEGRRVSMREQDETLEALVDAELVCLALSQLLDNATKYSRSGSSVSVSTKSEGDFIAIRVYNSGSTIPAGAKDHIFERFYRGPDTQQLTPGSGLGLYVARKIAIAHGGSLEIDDDDRHGESTVFALRLPIPQIEAGYAVTSL